MLLDTLKEHERDRCCSNSVPSSVSFRMFIREAILLVPTQFAIKVNYCSASISAYTLLCYLGTREDREIVSSGRHRCFRETTNSN